LLAFCSSLWDIRGRYPSIFEDMDKIIRRKCFVMSAQNLENVLSLKFEWCM